MLTVYLYQEILATQQNGAESLHRWTTDALSPWYTQSQSTHKKLPQGQSLCTYEAQQTVTYHCTALPSCERATHKSAAIIHSPKLFAVGTQGAAVPSSQTQLQ